LAVVLAPGVVTSVFIMRFTFALSVRAAHQEARAFEAERRSAQLESALLVVRTVAHEVNNALAPALGCAELLQDDPAVRGSASAMHLAQEIAAAADSAATRIRRLSAVARLDSAPTLDSAAGPILDLSAACRTPG
jgi:signal transduction histidine kinase